MSASGTLSNIFSKLFGSTRPPALVEAFCDKLDAVFGGSPRYVYLGPEQFSLITTAVPTYSVTNNLSQVVLDQGDETAFFFTTLNLPFDDNSGVGGLGLQLTSIKVLYKVATAALDDCTGTLSRFTIPVEGSAPVGEAVTTTDTLPLTADEHTGTMVVDTPADMDGATYCYNLGLLFDKAATSDLTFWGVVLVFEEP
jgi:hypothetical protein